LGAANEPKYIALPSVKAGGFVVKLGLNASGALATPNNIYTAGWFTGSVLPGKSGLSVMVGHVNGPTSDQAIFSGLARLQPGDIIQLTLGNDAKLGYRVRSVRSYSVNDSVNHLFSQEPDFTRQLNLITCSGSYDRATRSYSERTIVVAEQT
jgi:LPXTG-site transpeptidase (sortase) family protein